MIAIPHDPCNLWLQYIYCNVLQLIAVAIYCNLPLSVFLCLSGTRRPRRLESASCPQHCLGRSWSALSMKWWKLVYGWKGQPSNAFADSRGRHRLTNSRVALEINPLHEREMGLNPVGILGCGSHGLFGAWEKSFCVERRVDESDWLWWWCAVCGVVSAVQ